jgi:ribulose-5-phosphate 4-epimerase/fuculose-1-phosphate aldolase
MITAMGDVMRRCYEKGWITTRDGNVSLWNSGHPDRVYITPKGVRKYIIHPEHICKMKITKDKFGAPHIDINDSVSSEVHMHWRILKDVVSNSVGTRCVLHVHATHAVAAMYAGFNLREICLDFPEISRYTKVGRNVPKLDAGSLQLAQYTYANLMPTGYGRFMSDIVGQECHGVTAIGKHPWDAYEHVERLDHICEMVLKSGVRPPSIMDTSWNSLPDDFKRY